MREKPPFRIIPGGKDKKPEDAMSKLFGKPIEAYHSINPREEESPMNEESDARETYEEYRRELNDLIREKDKNLQERIDHLQDEIKRILKIYPHFDS